MSLISRITTWTSQILTASSLNGEFNNVVNTINNLDSATTPWTNIKAGNLTSTLSTTLKGSSTNDSAAAGNIGEYVSVVINSPTNFPTSNQYNDLALMSLTSGDWDVSCNLEADRGTATWAQVSVGLSLTSGNSSTGLQLGDNLSAFAFASTASAIADIGLAIPSYRVSSSGSTTIYLKYLSLYSAGGPPTAIGRISARRIR